MITTNSSTEFDQAIQSDKLVLVDFYADWCSPCKILKPILRDLEQEYEGLEVIVVNIEENPRLAERYRIQALPTMLFMRNGEILEKIIGLVNRADLRRYINSYEGIEE